MNNTDKEKPALLIIDMVKDYFIDKYNLPVTAPARKIIDPINNLSTEFRKNNWPVIFSTDSFKKSDFIFTSSMKPHAITGTEGAEITELLAREPEDMWVPKPRFSAFFNTGLEKKLKEMQITLCMVAGIATNFCVLTTVMDALCHDFKAVILEDCTAASKEFLHEQTLSLYRRNPIYPLLRVMTSAEALEALV
ncbi:MAG: cysteine hydrolase [Spirochaetes bacterium]|nr:cysteine hydrolase [Spirochaetota bacterium]